MSLETNGTSRGGGDGSLSLLSILFSWRSKSKLALVNLLVRFRLVVEGPDNNTRRLNCLFFFGAGGGEFGGELVIIGVAGRVAALEMPGEDGGEIEANLGTSSPEELDVSRCPTIYLDIDSGPLITWRRVVALRCF